MMARACACVKSTLLVVGIWLNQRQKQERRADECCESQARAPAVHERSGIKGKSACATSAAKAAGSQDSSRERFGLSQERRDKRDSPRISREIHIDRKQPLGVSLKGSSERVLATCDLDENPGSSIRQDCRCHKTKSFCSCQAKSAGWGQQVSRSSRLMAWGT